MTLTEIRRSKDMSLGECAKQVGIKPSELSQIEMGRRVPSKDELASIALTLGISGEQARAGLPDWDTAQKDLSKFNDAFQAMAAAKSDATAKGLKCGNGGAGEIECPICKGRLRYSVASVNGHLWGTCSTSGCVSWMQ